jgi:hypothetical protein
VDTRPAGGDPAAERDLAADLDDRARLRQLFEALRLRLSAREQQAAALCYLQGLSRAEAALAMGVSEARMRKLMEGQGPGRPGVARKVGALVETIRAGGWCEEQGSLMRGLAYGILDPDGARYQLALIHSSECPACRAYVASLRGLAAALPPIPSLLPLVVAGGAGASASTLGGAAATSPSLGGALPASGAAGAAGAGGGWLLAGGPLGTKLAASCLLALGVGAGCVVLGQGRQPPPARAHMRSPAAHGARAAPSLGPGTGATRSSQPLRADAAARAAAGPAPTPTLSAAARARREFGPEGFAPVAARSSALPRTPSANVASAGPARPAAAAEFSAARPAPSATGARSAHPAGGGAPTATAAQREFAPG